VELTKAGKPLRNWKYAIAKPTMAKIAQGCKPQWKNTYFIASCADAIVLGSPKGGPP